MKRLVIVLAALGVAAFQLGGMSLVARAETGPLITFEPPNYLPGSIDGQQGWAGSGGGPINPTYDQEVALTALYGSPAGFDTQSFRMSNAVTSGGFGDWPFSPSLANEA